LIANLRKYDAIIAAVESIPPGFVATYGQVADLAGLPGRARLVGKTMSQLPPESGVPWHRVVNSRGEISQRGDGISADEQRLLLIDEGVSINDQGRIRLAEFRWHS
jgi:methylated-DNA-protein-cysteine methyltransferase-like protein